MESESAPLPVLTADDLREYPWQELLRDHHTQECHSFLQPLFGAGEKSKGAGDELGERVYGFLGALASLRPDFDNRAVSYRPMWTNTNGSRSFALEDLTENDLDILSGIVHEITVPEYRARVADILWLCRKNFKDAQVAIPSFLESAEMLITDDDWIPYIERLRRAAQLSVPRGFEKQAVAVIASVEAGLSSYQEATKAGRLCAELISLLLYLKAPAVAQYAEIAEHKALHFSSLGDWSFAEEYWDVAGECHRRSKNETERQRCKIEGAECNVSAGEAFVSSDPPDHFCASHWMQIGLEKLRQASADQKRIEDIHRRLLELQKLARNEVKPTEIEVDIPGLQESLELTQNAATTFVSGLGFKEAVKKLSHIQHPTNTRALTARLVESGKEFIWDKIFGVTTVDATGKVADVSPALGLDEAEIDNEAFRKQMLRTVSEVDWPIAVDWKIEPARYQITQEHPLRLKDFDFLVAHNAFIPPGHETFYARGIQAGFHGDLVMAMHLLIPQIEASIRFILQQHGVVTSTLESEGTQKERDINNLLWDKKLDELFGPDILFDLRGILIEKSGCNMRNELAHGLMSYGSFYRTESVYLWWLVLRLCMGGRYKVRPQPTQQ